MLALAMHPIADQGVNVGLGDAIVVTGAVGTGETLGGDAFGGTPRALELTRGTYA